MSAMIVKKCFTTKMEREPTTDTWIKINLKLQNQGNPQILHHSLERKRHSNLMLVLCVPTFFHFCHTWNTTWKPNMILARKEKLIFKNEVTIWWKKKKILSHLHTTFDKYAWIFYCTIWFLYNSLDFRATYLIFVQFIGVWVQFILILHRVHWFFNKYDKHLC